MDNKSYTTICNNNVQAQLGTPCIVCGKSVPLTENEALLVGRGHCIHSKVCDKCKEAVVYIREQLKEKHND